MNLGMILKLAKGGFDADQISELARGMILKLAKGGFDADQISELARGMGWNLDFQDLMRDQRSMAFQRAAAGAVEPDSKAVAISGTDSRGNRVEALLILIPAEKLKKIA